MTAGEPSADGSGTKVVLRDPGRARFVLALAGFLVLCGVAAAGATPTAADRAAVFGAFAVLALVSARTAMLGVEVRDEGVRLRGYLRTRVVPWAAIAHFGKERLPGRLSAVPAVTLADGRRHPLYGLDSVFSGFGAASPLWDRAIAVLSDELARRRHARWG